MGLIKKGLLIFGFFILGVFVTLQSWDGEVYVNLESLKNSRNPAAIKKSFDYSQFNSTTALSSARESLLNEAQKRVEEDKVGFNFGNFIVGSKTKGYALACQMYDRVVIEYRGEGQFVNGEKPSFKIEAPCSLSEDIKHLSTIWIPTEKLQGEKPLDGELSYEEFAQVRYQFDYIGNEWPTEWVFEKIVLKDSSANQSELVVTRQDFGSQKTAGLNLVW